VKIVPTGMHKHDFHMTIGLGVLKELSQQQPDNNFLFLFQPAEENEAGGMLMYDDCHVKIVPTGMHKPWSF
jgi:metal-dependent amidase/aminoacylase/carboxypeptidase family protein